MRGLLIVLSLLATGSAQACPDLSGKFLTSDEPGSAYYVYQQQGCEKISAKYCLGSEDACSPFQIWIDGKYRSVGNADAPCTDFDCRSFTWSGDSLVINQKANQTFTRAFPRKVNVECTTHEESWSVDSDKSMIVTKKNAVCENGFKGDLIVSRLRGVALHPNLE